MKNKNNKNTRINNRTSIHPKGYSIGDLTKLFSVTVRTIQKWEEAGKIPIAYRTLGGHRRWNKSEIDTFFEQYLIRKGENISNAEV